MNLTNLIEGFVYGELSPLMAGQISSKAYKQSASELTNMIPDARGPVTSRPGAVMKHTIPAETCKLFSLQVAPSTSYIIALTNQEATIIPNDVNEHKPNLMSNGTFMADSLSWKVESVGAATAEFGYRKTVLKPGTEVGEYVELRQSVQVPDSALDYRLTLTGLFRGETSNQALQLMVGSTIGGDDIASVHLYNYKTFHELDILAPGYETLHITLRALDWAGTGITDTEIYLEYIHLHELAPVAATAVSVIPSPYTTAQLKQVRGVRVPNENKIFLLHKDVAPQQLYTDDFSTWTIEDITFTAKPPTWIEGSFPTTVTFYQSRSVWGGIANDQETFLMSKTGDYYDLTTGDLADDALSFTIDREGLIRWILGSKELLLGTVNGEYKIGSDSGVIMPDDIRIDLQSAHGAGDTVPIMVGTETAFVSVDARTIRAMSYFWEDDGWVAEDLGFGSDHITYSGIFELHAALNPEPILWCVLNNGIMAGCSYQFQNSGSSKDRKITGWHRHKFSLPVVSATVVEDYGHSIPFVAFKAEVDGQTEIHICYVDFGSERTVYLDDSVRITSNEPITLINGLDHLEGYEVEILADDATHARKTVFNGSIELDEPAQQIIVGLGFSAKLVTQPVAIETRMGTYKYQPGRWYDAFVYLLDSALPLLEGLRAEEFEADSRMGFRQDRVTGYTNSAQFGWNRDTVLTIEQDLPLPLTISHIAGELEK